MSIEIQKQIDSVVQWLFKGTLMICASLAVYIFGGISTDLQSLKSSVNLIKETVIITQVKVEAHGEDIKDLKKKVYAK